MSTQRESRPRVLYVVGAARSGSTVLQTVLGSHPQIEGVGELGFLSRSGHVFEEYCACGEPADVCPYWSEVRRVWARYGGPHDLAEYIALQREFEGEKWRLKRLLRHRHRPSLRFQAYAQQVRTLLQAISTVSGKRIVADTTKTPSRALVLSMIAGIDLRIVHLVRDGRGVAWSVKKGLRKDDRGGVQTDQPPRSVLRTAAYWVVLNLQSAWVRTQLAPQKSVRIRYEDFMAQPKETLDRIGALLDCDFSEVAKALESEATFPSGHAVAGNRLRMVGTVRLNPDKEWSQKMSAKDRMLFQAVAGALMWQYGYK